MVIRRGRTETVTATLFLLVASLPGRHYFHCMDLGSDSLRNVDSIILGVGSEER